MFVTCSNIFSRKFVLLLKIQKTATAVVAEPLMMGAIPTKKVVGFCWTGL
jgi:hypothetical protein